MPASRSSRSPLLDLDTRVAVLANVRTGAPGRVLEMGHVVVLHGFGSTRVGVADTCRELGAGYGNDEGRSTKAVQVGAEVSSPPAHD